MMRRLYHLLSLVCITVTLALAGLVAAAAYTGKLSDERLAKLAEVIRAEDAAEPDAPLAGAALAASPQPAHGTPASLEVLQRELDRRQRELEYQDEQLQQLRRLVAQEREELRQARTSFYEQATAQREQAQDESFQELVKLYESLQPRQVKDILMEMEATQAARYLEAMNRRTASKIIGQFRSEMEKTHLQQVLSQMQAG